MAVSRPRRSDPGYFAAFDRPIVAGRGFNRGDTSPGARAIVVNEAFARGFSRQTGTASPIGSRLRFAVVPDDDKVDGAAANGVGAMG